MRSNNYTDNRTKLPAKIHVYSSGETGIFANASLVGTKNGIVAIDSTLTVSESKSLKARLDAIGKPLLAVILTHAHPDHVAGVTNLVQSSSTDTPVIALESVEGLMRSTEESRGTDWKEIEKHILTEVLNNPVGRLGTIEDVANLVAFVSSPLASYINGANLRVDGGSTVTIN